MELKDLIITPLYLIIVYFGAYWYRSKIKDKVLKKYFIPALTFKIIGAISLGLIYQFYYDGGDTFHYFEQGSVIYAAFINSPLEGVKLLIEGDNYSPSISKYVYQIKWYFAKEYFIVKASAIFSLISFDNYTTVAVLFATTSFCSVLLLYKVFITEFPFHKKKIALILFFIPSVVFWGSGITKDTLTMIGLNIMLYSLYFIVLKKKLVLLNFILLFLSIYILLNTKTYILLAFIPSFSAWYFASINYKIKSTVIKFFMIPVFLFIAGFTAYYGIGTIIKDESKYSINNLSNTVNIASLYHNSISTTSANVKRGHGGSGYGMENFDGTLGGVLKLGPQAFIIALYRPFLWEIRNPMMILSALENILLLFLTYLSIKRNGLGIYKHIKKPAILFCLIFALVIAISTGLTSGNFGNLSRYRIPALPFFCIALIVISNQKGSKKYHYLKGQNIS